MPEIHVLDQSTINQIAAGEVIERPASVVKELLENAIDAKASAVTVEIKEGGIGFIRITDNGCGIDKNDVKVAFLRHSTSKIKTAEDLLTVSSLGFRGEALSSIAAVGQVELITKTKSSLTGVRYIIEGGQEKELSEIGVPDGTTFIVRNLFFNTPARRKFLKSPMTEGGYISDIVERIALSHPEVSIRFIVNGQNKLHTSGNGNIKDVIYNVFGRDIASNILEIKNENEFMKVKGFIGKPVISRGNRNYENYFINGRYIRSGLISKAIEEAYKPFMMQHKYPFTALHIEIDSELLDVNVHPTKMELRFRNQEQLYPYVLKLIGDTISGRELIPESVCDDEKTQNERVKAEVKEQRKLVAYKPLPEPFEIGRQKKMAETERQTERHISKPFEIPVKTNSTVIRENGSPAGIYNKPSEIIPEKSMNPEIKKDTEEDIKAEINEDIKAEINPLTKDEPEVETKPEQMTLLTISSCPKLPEKSISLWDRCLTLTGLYSTGIRCLLSTSMPPMRRCSMREHWQDTGKERLYPKQ